MAAEPPLPPSSVELGFLEPPQDVGVGMHATLDYRDWDGGSVGGKPSWLDPSCLPKPSSFRCESCGEPLTFLLQIYAPLDDIAGAFHRSVYVFCCRNGACLQKSSGLLALRCQLPQENSFYPSDPGEAPAAPAPEAAAPLVRRRLCGVCGCPGDSCCSKCKNAWYCCRSHQLAHWKGGHKALCGQPASAALAAPLTGPAAAVQLPMFDIVIENEAQVREDAGLDADLDTAAGSGVGGGGGGGGGLVAGGLDGADRQLQQEEGKQGDEEARLRKKYLGETGEGQPQSDESRGEDITEEDCKEAMRALRGTDVIEEEDEVLNAFQERVAVAKDQVLRYARWPSDTDAARGVLWTATKQKAAAGDIPACPHCGGERAFEFQVTPQMLHYLGMVGGEEQGQQGQQEQQQQQDMSWGTLAVFTCRGSCGGEPTEDFGAYRKEFIWRQPAAGEK